MFTYPASDLDRPARLVSLLGQFWTSTYPGSELVSQLLYARGQMAVQTNIRLNEVANEVSQVTIEPFRTQQWYRFAALQSELNAPEIAMPVYGQGYTYEASGGIQYGTPVIGLAEYALPLPANLHDVLLICNRLTQPSVTLVRDLDFRIDLRRRAILFRENPFTNPLFSQQQQIANGGVVDSTINLWLFRGQFDFNDLYQQFGYVVGLQAPSSDAYKRLINAVFGALIEGGSLQYVQQMFSAVTGVPLVINDAETVELLTEDAEWQYVITDQNVYTFQLSATPVVSVGQTVHAGDPLVTALQFDELQNGQIPDGLTALGIGKGFLLSGYYGNLIFQNADVPLQVSTVDGFTKIEFELGGFPGDIDAFWEQLHANGIAKGQTLAMLLDTRPHPVGQPTAASLPATINPLGFLIANVLRNNVSLVRIITTDTNPGTMNLGLARVLRKILPPHTAVIVLVELSGSEDPVILDGSPPTETTPGSLESGSFFQAPDTAGDVIDPDSYVTENGRLWQLSGFCR